MVKHQGVSEVFPSFFFDMDRGINLKYIKVMYKNKINFNLVLVKR
jgi:hypothetical protein